MMNYRLVFAKLTWFLFLESYSTITDIEKQNIVEEFLALKAKIPNIVNLEAGLNNSTEGLDKGFTHIFIVSFNSIQDREDYVYQNQDHDKFKKRVGPLLDGGANGVIVLDFNTGGENQ